VRTTTGLNGGLGLGLAIMISGTAGGTIYADSAKIWKKTAFTIESAHIGRQQ